MSITDKKTVLAIDTALGGVSVGIIATNGHIVSRMIETAREQAVILVPTIQEVVEEAQCKFLDVDLIACSQGPGSFTGLRIGLATARTMALALNKSLVGLNTLDVMAKHYQTAKPVLIVLETKRQDFYACYYDEERNPISEPIASDAQTILQHAPVVDYDVGGDCLERFKACVAKEISVLDNLTQPDPILMCQIGIEKFEVYGADERVDPLYLRGAGVSEPKIKPRKLAGV
jgi:tRNA threonylcarbamoyladenosine biosynthesis protein TsaB